MGHLAIFALGPLRIELDGKLLQTSRHKALALLVYLAMRQGKQSREVLSGLLWPDYEQKKAYAYLRRTLWEIQNLLGKGWLEADREAICFSSHADVNLDVAVFQSHLAAASRRHDHPASGVCLDCAAHLHTAALLYRGDFLTGFNLRDSPGFEDWQFFQSQSLRLDYAHTLQELVVLLRLRGDYDQASVFARRWLALDPLIEEAHRELMKIYAQRGQRTTALRQYQECQRLLRAELNVSPEAETTDLFEQIQSGELTRTDVNQADLPINTPHIAVESDRSQIWTELKLPVKESISTHTLQAQYRTFVGRQLELDHIAARLSDPECWLVTLLGPGGIGKTRLALEAGTKYQYRFPHGVFFVPLNIVESAQSIVPAIAKAAGLLFRQDGPAPEIQLLDFLHEKQILLIMDSFETLVQSADLLTAIHYQAKEVKMLVTTRHRLPLKEAWVVEVKGLEYPQNQVENYEEFLGYSAVELFLMAARRADVEFQMQESDLPAVTRITQLLEGLPLGLELAATWIKMLSCQGIASELTRSLDFLETPLKDLPERQRSIRAVFDYSWNLLNSREQRLFPRLAVFRGGFTRQSAEYVAGISLRELAGLVDKSLVQRTSEGRFMLHDLLRQYSLEILDRNMTDSLETQDRHRSYYCTRLSEWNAGLGGEKQGQVLREIEADLENTLTAWGRAVSRGQTAQIDQAAEGLCMFFLRRARFTEGLTICQDAETALRLFGSVESRVLISRLSIWQAVFSMNLEKYPEAVQFLDVSQAIIDDTQMNPQLVIKERVFLLTIKAELAILQYNPSFVNLFKQSIDQARKAGIAIRWTVFFWRYFMGAGTASEQLYIMIKKSLPDLRTSGDQFEIGCTLFTLGILAAFWYNRLEEAEPLLKECCEIFQMLDDPVSQVMIYKSQGYLLLIKGRYIECLGLKQHELKIYQNLGDRRMIGIYHAEVGECLTHLGRYEEAEVQLRMGLELLEQTVEQQFALRQRYLGDNLLAQGKCREALESYQYSFNFFQSVSEKTWMFTALTGLSRAEFALGDRSGACTHAIQALQLFREGNVFHFFAYPLLGVFAILVADKGETTQALELYEIAASQPNLAHSPWFTDVYGRFITAAAEKLPVEVQASARKSGQSHDLSWAIEYLLSTYGKDEQAKTQ